MPLLASDTAQILEAKLIERQAKDFLGRAWLVDEIKVLLDQVETRYVILTGPPGVGKTALWSHLARSHPSWLRFFIRADGNQALRSPDAKTFYLSIGCQLAVRYPEAFEPAQIQIVVQQRIGHVAEGGRACGVYIEKFESSPFRKVAIEVRQQLESLAGDAHGVYIERFVADLRSFSVEDLAYMALLDPLEVLITSRPDERVIILVDALDESRFSGRDNPDHFATTRDIIWALERLPVLPPNVRIVANSRPEVFVERLLGRSVTQVRHLELSTQDLRNQADLRAYVEKRLEQGPYQRLLTEQDCSAATVANRLLARADGSFLYLKSLLDAAGAALEEPDHKSRAMSLLLSGPLPKDVSALYGYLVGQLIEDVRSKYGRDCWERSVAPILGTLVLAREPLDLLQLATFSRVTGQDTLGLLNELSQFIDRIEVEEPLYRLFHSSFAEFLIDRAQNRILWIDPGIAEARTIDTCLDSWGGFGVDLNAIDMSRSSSVYGLRHLVRHLHNRGDTDRLLQVVTSPFYLSAKVAIGLLSDTADECELALRKVDSDQTAAILATIRDLIIGEYEWLKVNPAAFLPQLSNRLAFIESKPNNKGLTFAERLSQALVYSKVRWLRRTTPRSTRVGSVIPALPGKNGLRQFGCCLSAGRLLLGSSDGSLELWHENGSIEPLQFDGDGLIRAVATMSSSSVLIVMLGEVLGEKILAILDLQSGRTTEIARFHCGYVRDLSVESKNLAVVVGFDGGDHCARYFVIDIPTGAILVEQEVVTVGEPVAAHLTGRLLTLVTRSSDRATPFDQWSLWGGRLDKGLILVGRLRNKSFDLVRFVALCVLVKVGFNPRSLSDHASALIGGVNAVTLLESNGTFALACQDMVFVLSPRGGEPELAYRHDTYITGLLETRNGRLLVIGEVTRIVDLRVRERIREQQSGGAICTVAVLPDGQHLLVGSSGPLEVWNPISGRRTPSPWPQIPGFEVATAVVRNDGVLVMASLLDGKAVAVDAMGDNIWGFAVPSSKVVVGPQDSVLFLTNNGGKSLQTFLELDFKGSGVRTTNVTLDPQMGGYDFMMAFTTQSGRYLLYCAQGVVLIRDLLSDETKRVTTVEVSARIVGLGLLGDGCVATAGAEGVVTIYDQEGNKVAASYFPEGIEAMATSAALNRITICLNDGDVFAAALEPQGLAYETRFKTGRIRWWPYSVMHWRKLKLHGLRELRGQFVFGMLLSAVIVLFRGEFQWSKHFPAGLIVLLLIMAIVSFSIALLVNVFDWFVLPCWRSFRLHRRLSRNRTAARTS